MPNEQQLSELMHDFARTMVTDFPIQAILDRLVDRIVHILPITGAGVTLISPANVPLYIAASDAAALKYEQLQTLSAEGPCLLSCQTNVAVAAPDLGRDGRFPTFRPQAWAAGLRAVFTFPLRHGDRQLGALDLYRDEPGELSVEALAAAQTLADVAAAYLLNAQARADLLDSWDRSRQASLHDALTGLPNRILLLNRLKHAILRDQRTGKATAVLFVDLDRFKTINDSHGHRVGDTLLVAVAGRLSTVLRPHDTLARLSGDEFVVICEDLDTAGQAEAVGSRLDAALAQPFFLATVETDVTASIGIAFTQSGERGPEELLHEADLAMYQAKRAGGRRQAVFDPSLEVVAENDAGLRQDLHRALGRGQLSLEYQPIVTSRDGRITGFEALLFWTHPTRGRVDPAVVIPIAEQSGLVMDIGRWVLDVSWAERNRWQIPYRGVDFGVSVNVSGLQLTSPGFTASVEAAVTAAHADPRLLTLEVTESAHIRDRGRARFVLDDLKTLGVTIALDDFGTGYSGLSNLKEFPVDIVKIDRSFVGALGRDVASGAIVKAVVNLAHDLGKTVVAAGVETVDQHEQITELGCDFAQGHYFARPTPADRIGTLIGGNINLPTRAAGETGNAAGPRGSSSTSRINVAEM